MNNHGPPNVYITSLVDMRVTQPGHLWGKEVSEAGWVGCIWFTSGRQRPQTPGQVHVKVNIFVPEKKKKKPVKPAWKVITIYLTPTWTTYHQSSLALFPLVVS